MVSVPETKNFSHFPSSRLLIYLPCSQPLRHGIPFRISRACDLLNRIFAFARIKAACFWSPCCIQQLIRAQSNLPGRHDARPSGLLGFCGATRIRLAIDKTASRLRLALGMCSHRLNYYRHRVDCCHFGFWPFGPLPSSLQLS